MSCIRPIHAVGTLLVGLTFSVTAFGQAPPPDASTTRRDATYAPAERERKRLLIRYESDRSRNIHFRSDLRTFYLPHGAVLRYDPYSAEWALEAAYLARRAEDRANLLRLYRFRDARDRNARLLNRHEAAVREGVAHLRYGEIVPAIRALTLAAKLNQADPACRVHLAQARLARGNYTEAALALRRALELQPKLIYVDLDLDSYYPQPGMLRRYTEALRAQLAQRRATADEYFLLGFLLFQLQDYDAAHAAFARVAAVEPDDDLTRELALLTLPAGE
ncbi:MAG: hypothetical protein D6744_04165 [Planctomycetota bacterium]|nr:MAG: hypothetical protein D6744_04165 [Planctomycetota bacterium]